MHISADSIRLWILFYLNTSWIPLNFTVYFYLFCTALEWNCFVVLNYFFYLRRISLSKGFKYGSNLKRFSISLTSTFMGSMISDFFVFLSISFNYIFRSLPHRPTNWIAWDVLDNCEFMCRRCQALLRVRILCVGVDQLFFAFVVLFHLLKACRFWSTFKGALGK